MRSAAPHIVLAVLALGFSGSTGFADVTVKFVEGAPKDRFTIANTDACPLGATDIEIDLSGSVAGLIFDVTSNGAGVEVFQPFELVGGSSAVLEQPTVRDGDQRLLLKLNELSDQQPISFTIDVDDTVSARQITVSGSEIAGAQFTVQSAMGTVTGTFGPDAHATVALSGCSS